MLFVKGLNMTKRKIKKGLDLKIGKLEYILERLSSNEYLQDIFPSLELPSEFVNQMRYINIEIANKQQIMINKIVVYIKNNNYYGDKYHEYRESQINASNWWIKTYFSEKYNKNLSSNMEEISKYNQQEEIQFSKKLV